MFHKEGQNIIITTLCVVVAATLTAEFYIATDWIRITVQLIALAFLIAILQFFRNPKRVVTPNFDMILSPVDGKVVVIEEVEEPEYFKDKRLQVSIFMSPVNVHVTRYPASGTVTYSKYHPGKYLVAWHPKSSTDNERTTVVLRTPKFGEIGYRQIAGALARRIVNYAKAETPVFQGQDAGFIKFGSRVDLLLPLDCAITVQLNQKVIGGKTCIATLQKDNDGSRTT